jgi:hypothetical protein
MKKRENVINGIHPAVSMGEFDGVIDEAKGSIRR